jgi:hypothetical protein
MLLFKTSGRTFDSVITNMKHAFASKPRDWSPGEKVLVSKNKVDCNHNEKQIRYSMKLVDIRPANHTEIERLWPGNRGRWKYIVDCKDAQLLERPFDLQEVLGEKSTHYNSIITYCRFLGPDEKKIEKYLIS